MAGFERAAQRRPFPALDPEPPPRPWWRRLLIPAAVLALAAAIVAAVVLRPFAAAAPRAAGNSARLARLPGRIAVVTAAGNLVLADPDGGHPARAAGNVGDAVTAAPDDRYLALFNGQVLAVRPGRPLALDHTEVLLSSATSAAWPDPFADHERDLVMLLDYGEQSESATIPVSVVSLATGRAISLGVGDQVAGDPQAPGAFVSVAAAVAPSASSTPVTLDSEVVLRDAGRPPVRLATAGALASDLGYAGTVPAALDPSPSPSGAEVAVTVQPEGGSVAGIVVLSRTGRLLGRVTTPLGLLSLPAWSPSGRSLAYLARTAGGGGSQLDIWTVGGHPVAGRLPAGSSRFGTCLWSPDGTSILVGGDRSGDWAVGSVAGGPLAAVHGPGLPVAWLPAPGGR